MARLTITGMIQPRFTAVVAGVLLAMAPMRATVVYAAPPDILTRFTPSLTVPGNWQEGPVGRLEGVDTGAGICAPGGSRTWTRQDSTAFTLNWWTCPPGAADELADEVLATRLRMGSLPGVVSYLGGADAVFPVRQAAVRSWVQESYSIQLLVDCPTMEFAECAPLSGEAARQIAAGLPGEPSTTALLPSFSEFLAAVLMLWFFVVGIRMFVQWVLRPRFDVGIGDPCLVSVDGSARTLRWKYRGRRTAYVIGLLSALSLLGAVLNPKDGIMVFAVRLTFFLAILGLAVGLFLMCRHPMLGATIPASRRFRMAHLSMRRVLGAVVVVVLMVVLSVAPFAAILVLMTLGFIVQGGSSGMTDAFAQMLFVTALIVIVALGFLIDRIGRRLRARNAWEAISADPRPTILYLRNFGDDKQKVPASALGRAGVWQILTVWLNPVRTNRFEEVLARALARFGPVIAVDPPSTRFSRLGAAKTLLPHEGWLQQVTEWAEAAHAVVVSAVPTEVRPGLRDELKMLAEALPHGRVVLILGPHRKKSLLHAASERFLQAVHQYPMFRAIADRPVADGTLVLVHMPKYGWGYWHGWSGRRRTAWTYTAAIHEAMSKAGDAWQSPAQATSAMTNPVKYMATNDPGVHCSK